MAATKRKMTAADKAEAQGPCDWDDDHNHPPTPCIVCGTDVAFGTSNCPKCGVDQWIAKRAQKDGIIHAPQRVVVEVMGDMVTGDLHPKVAAATDGGARDPKRRPNKYAADCVKCGQRVEGEAGYLTKDAAGRWAAEHVTCPAPIERPKPEPAAPKAEPVDLQGMHKLEDGTIYKVQIAHHGSGNPYAKRLVLHHEDGLEISMQHGVPKKATFEYAPGAMKKLSVDTKMTLAEAKAFGRLYGICCNCGAILTDETSIEAGIGPVCAGRFE